MVCVMINFSAVINGAVVVVVPVSTLQRVQRFKTHRVEHIRKQIPVPIGTSIQYEQCQQLPIINVAVQVKARVCEVHSSHSIQYIASYYCI